MNLRQQQFVIEYLRDLNATAAYLRAGYKATQRHTAEAAGSALLRHHEVAAEIKAAMEERGERTKMTADRVLLELERMAAIDPTRYADVKSLKDLKKLPPEYRRAVVGWSYDKKGNFILKLAKEFALDRMGKHHRLFAEVIEHDVTDALAERMAKARERAKSTTTKEAPP